MRYLTDRKRAIGKGAAHSGTEHHWFMQVTSVGLALMIPVWLYIFGRTLGQGQEAVVATFARPFPAILTALVLVVGMRHFAKGATMMIEDYAHGTTRHVLVIGAICLSYAIMATGLFALVRIAI
ncbi:MAG TPA: succinate dehydrogenase, hydrophobic membrane anchor protein [Paracoccaceae bacterium]|nr:succinate dehydrogenase, hydrophobic membrane anchor protein [Paracoccaceae bacterium]